MLCRGHPKEAKKKTPRTQRHTTQQFYLHRFRNTASPFPFFRFNHPHCTCNPFAAPIQLSLQAKSQSHPHSRTKRNQKQKRKRLTLCKTKSNRRKRNQSKPASLHAFSLVFAAFVSHKNAQVFPQQQPRNLLETKSKRAKSTDKRFRPFFLCISAFSFRLLCSILSLQSPATCPFFLQSTQEKHTSTLSFFFCFKETSSKRLASHFNKSQHKNSKAYTTRSRSPFLLFPFFPSCRQHSSPSTLFACLDFQPSAPKTVWFRTMKSIQSQRNPNRHNASRNPDAFDKQRCIEKYTSPKRNQKELLLVFEPTFMPQVFSPK